MFEPAGLGDPSDAKNVCMYGMKLQRPVAKRSRGLQ